MDSSTEMQEVSVAKIAAEEQGTHKRARFFLYEAAIV